MIKKLDTLLSEIAKQPFYRDIEYTAREVRFLHELAKLRRVNYEEFARYLHAYNEVRNARLTSSE